LKGGVFVVDAAVAFITFRGLLPDTNHYIRAKAVGQGDWGTSDYSAVATFKTGSVPEGGGMVGDLLNWLNELQTEFQNVATLVPQLESTVLNTTDRRRLLGSGVRRYGFIEKVLEVSAEYPQFWPAFVKDKHIERFAETVKEIDVLRNLFIWLQFSGRVVQDMLLIAGNDAFRTAGLYYTTARDTALRKIPEAVQVYEKLRLFWQRRRRTTEEPTMDELERNFKSVVHGTKDGTVSAHHESPKLVGGSHKVVDTVHGRKG